MIAAATPEAIKQAASLLSAGKLVAFPTETVYGLGADASNREAVLEIFKVKARPCFDPLIVHVHDVAQLSEVIDFNRLAQRPIFERLCALWPGPLTLVVPARKEVLPELRANLPSVAVRIPRHQVSLDLLREFGAPVAAPSANPFGYVSPTCAAHVADQLGAKIGMVLDGGACEIGLESTIVSLMEPVPTLLRPGGAALEEIERLVGTLKIRSREVVTSANPQAPGMLEHHYAPRAKVFFKSEVSPAQFKHCTLISFSKIDQSEASLFARVVELSPSADLTQVAHSLFAVLRQLDADGVGQILVDQCEEAGIGRAIMDRLRRAHA